MKALSRRSFLQFSGISLSVASLSKISLLANLSIREYRGRALEALPVFESRSLTGQATAYLWPDSIVSLLDSDKNWYRIPAGYVSRAGIQPMTPFQVDENLSTFNGPFWAEVAGPVASVREICAANAALVTRIGHGGVARVVDFLPGEPLGWYRIQDDTGRFLGWTQATVWRPVSTEYRVPSTESGVEKVLKFNRRDYQVTALENGKTVFQTNYASGQALASGVYRVQGQQASGRWTGDTSYYGMPWQTHFGEGLSIAGVYWHNRFGESVPGPAVQTTPAAARWLYEWLDEHGTILVT